MGDESDDERVFNTGKPHARILPDGGEQDNDTGEGDEDDTEQDGESDDERQTHELAITVENEDGSYVQNAAVTAEDMEGGLLDEPQQQETGSDGEVTFRLADGDYLVEADADGDSAEQQVAVDGEDETLTLTVVTEDEAPETHELRVSVESGEGDPIPQADLTVESDEMGVVEGLLDSPERQGTDSGGDATFELENAEYTVEADAAGEQIERTVELDGEDEAVTLTVDVEDEEEAEAESEDEQERGGPKEAEGAVADEESESHGTERGTTVLYLDLEGLFLDLLGLEVDLHEVVLDIRAIPGGGNLLGNLLSAVAGLLGGGPISVLLNRLLNSVSKLLDWLTSPLSSLRSLASRIWDVLTSPLDWLRSVANNLGNTLSAPISWLTSAASRVWDVLTSPLSALWSGLVRLWDVLTAPVSWLQTDTGDTESADDGTPSIGERVPDVLPDVDRLTQALTSVLDELSGEPDEEGTGDEDEPDSSTAGRQLGEILGRRLGDFITGMLGGSTTNETSDS